MTSKDALAELYCRAVNNMSDYDEYKDRDKKGISEVSLMTLLNTLSTDLKVLEIIKNRRPNINDIYSCFDYTAYEACHTTQDERLLLTEEEFKLIKKEIGNEGMLD